MQDWEHLPRPVRHHLLVFLRNNHGESLQSRIDMDMDAEELTCQGCNRTGHKREDCYFKTHPDFVKKGQWIGSATERAVTAHLRTQDKTDRISRPVLLRHLRADGTRIEEREVPQPPTPPQNQDSSGRCDRDDRNRRGDQGDRGADRNRRGGRSGVHFDTQDRGTPCRTDIITHLSCNCGGSDENSTFRQCLVSNNASDQSFTALTLFDTGAYTSFVNREVAKWLEQQ
jgi:hypothetical protein